MGFRERVLCLAGACFGLGRQAARGLVRSQVEITRGSAAQRRGLHPHEKNSLCPLIPPAAQANRLPPSAMLPISCNFKSCRITRDKATAVKYRFVLKQVPPNRNFQKYPNICINTNAVGEIWIIPICRSDQGYLLVYLICFISTYPVDRVIHCLKN